MNSSALSDMNEKEGMYYLHKWKVQMRSCFTKKKLTKNLKEVLPAVKIIKLRKSEEGFNRKLLHQYRDSKKINHYYFTAVLFHNSYYGIGFYFKNFIRIILFLPAAIAV
jgi:hypothetical protein